MKLSRLSVILAALRFANGDRPDAWGAGGPGKKRGSEGDQLWAAGDDPLSGPDAVSDGSEVTASFPVSTPAVSPMMGTPEAEKQIDSKVTETYDRVDKAERLFETRNTLQTKDEAFFLQKIHTKNDVIRELGQHIKRATVREELDEDSPIFAALTYEAKSKRETMAAAQEQMTKVKEEAKNVGKFHQEMIDHIIEAALLVINSSQQHFLDEATDRAVLDISRAQFLQPEMIEKIRVPEQMPEMKDIVGVNGSNVNTDTTANTDTNADTTTTKSDTSGTWGDDVLGSGGVKATNASNSSMASGRVSFAPASLLATLLFFLWLPDLIIAFG